MTIFTPSRVATACIAMLGLVSSVGHAQQVALLDSGVDPDAGYNLAPGFNYFLDIEDTSDVSDLEPEGHGTISARLVSEAFSGQIVPFVITDGAAEREFEDRVLVARDNALSDVLGRDNVRVVGITKASPGVANSSASLMPELSNAGKVIVIMAGNDSANQPSPLATASFNLSGVIIVGATDTDGVLLPTSNKAGTTANKFVAAIGSPASDETPGPGGSSWASARITGIAGAVLQQNPDLTAQQVLEVIFDSAEDRGEEGTDSVYGRGVILSASQVLDNVMGPVTVPVTPVTPPVESGGGGGGGGGGAAGLLLGGALIGALVLAKRPSKKLEKTLVLDSYGRAFELDLSDQISVNDGSLHLNDFFHSLSQQNVGSGVYLPDLKTEVGFQATTTQDHRVDLIEYFAMPGDVVMQDRAADVSLALRSQLTRQVSLDAGYRINPSHTYGAVSQLNSHSEFGTSSFISGQAFDSVLSGFSSQAQSASLSYTPKAFGKMNMKLGMVSVDQPQRFGQDTLSTIFEGGYQFNDHAGIRLQFGQIEEQGSLFGGAAGGIFGVETATTYAVNVSGKIQASDKFAVVANYGVGKTKVQSSEQSLLNGFSSLRSDWYSIGLIGNDVFRAQDQMGFAFSQPLKIRSGGVDYAIPNGRAFNGDILFDRERINLSDTGATERSLEAYYRTMLGNKVELGGFVSFRENPNHVSVDGNEALAMMTLRYRH